MYSAYGVEEDRETVRVSRGEMTSFGVSGQYRELLSYIRENTKIMCLREVVHSLECPLLLVHGLQKHQGLFSSLGWQVGNYEIHQVLNTNSHKPCFSVPRHTNIIPTANKIVCGLLFPFPHILST